jgi:FkbM family methyltransferase
MNPLLIRARSIARKTGVIGILNRLRPAGSYEEHFHEALVTAVRPGDVVWDIGANVGLYTEQFCQWVGRDGFVVAFEPGVEACASIHERIPNCAWLLVENAALGETDTTGRLVIAEGSVDNHVATDADTAAGDANSIPVVISRGETVRNRLGRTPNVVKVDVEGFEEEVLLGMGEVLASHELRSVLVEVHFLKLEVRGRATAPVRIEKLLKSKGFATNWVDASHLVATR